MSNKIACFIHSTHIKECGTVILDDILNYLDSRNCFDKFDFLFINNIGIELDEFKYKQLNKKIIVSNYSDDVTLFECCTIKQIITFSKLNPDYKILYLHTKGVTHINDEHLYPIVKSWAHYMLYGLADKMSCCIEMLDDYDTLGSNLHNIPEPHYSGNFWWARASYLKKLNMLCFATKYDAETKILSQNPSIFNINDMVKMYDSIYVLDEYKHNIDSRFELYKNNKYSNVTFCNFRNSDDTNKLNVLSILTACIYNCMEKKQADEQFIILPPLAINENKQLLLDTIINIEHINQTLKKNNIMIINKSNLHHYIKSITYGVEHANLIDIKQIVMNKYFNDNVINIPDPSLFNTYCYDPAPCVYKNLYITYSFSIHGKKHFEIVDIYKEGESVDINFTSIQKLHFEDKYNTFSQDDSNLIKLLDGFGCFPTLNL